MVNPEVTGLLIEQLTEIIDERKIGFKKASEKISDPYLKELFKSHSSYSDVLKNELTKYSDIIGNTSLSEAHSVKWKYWFEMKSALKSSARADLLSACLNGEQRLIDLYQELLNDPQVTPNFKAILKKQFEDIKTACDLLKIFKICL